jgi:dsDNA-specific endonuclease/ATPase MutS2
VERRYFSMTDPDLPELLERLHTELERTKSLDEQGRERLRHLDRDIRDLLERSGEEVDDNILERLQDSIDHFEATHPRITSMLSEMMRILSNAGI